MLPSPKSITSRDVGTQYDQLDRLYRTIWGETLHHGLWKKRDSRDVKAGTERLLSLLLSPLQPAPYSRVIDIGCGYGTDAIKIAEQSGASVTGITISHCQATRARQNPAPARGAVEIQHGDWLKNHFADHSFDSAIAVESLCHMEDSPSFFKELHRVLVPGGRAALSCWSTVPDPSPLESILLRYLCLEGALPTLGTLLDYRILAEDSGLSMTSHHDLTEMAEPTWSIMAQRILRHLPTPRFLTGSLPLALRRPLLSLTVPAMFLAYRTGVLRYTLFWLEKRS